MVEITTGAKEHLLDRLPDGTSEVCFRVVPTSGRELALNLTVPEKTDVQVTHEGNVILSMEPSVARRLDGWVLDVDVREGGERQLILTPSPPQGWRNGRES